MISGSVYAKEKINETVQANIRPEISIERNDDDNTVEINVTHIRGIKTLTYRWNDDDEIMVDGRNAKNISETIDLIGGENTLKVTVTEENGQIKILEKTFIAGNIPEIEIIEVIDNGIKVAVRSDEKIDYIEYQWDDEDPQKIEVGEEEYEGIINISKGRHMLKIEATDINGIKGTFEKEIIGDTVPTVNVQSKYINGKAAFVIDAEDDENIKTIEIIHNGGEKQTINVDSATYHEEIEMTEGEENTIIVTVTNLNGLQKTRKIRVKNM